MWEPIRQQGNLTDRIVEQVERMISDESLKPGDRLPSEREMAELLGVSRPSLRESVRILQARGRLAVRHGQGVFVLAPAPERELRAALADTQLTLEELYAMREVLEVAAAGWAATSASPEVLADIRSALDALNAAGEQDLKDEDKLRELDANFHLAIAVAAGNRFLRQTSAVMRDMIVSGMRTTLMIPGRIDSARTEHERIYAGITAGDAAGARRAARAHIRGAHRAAIARLERERSEVALGTGRTGRSAGRTSASRTAAGSR
jgi:GntR family transcriptional repressor for pyruvate dehydrogenase complex